MLWNIVLALFAITVVGIIITVLICFQNNIDLSNNKLFDLIVKTIFSILISIPFIYYIFIRSIYLQIKLYKAKKLIETKQYALLNDMALSLYNKNQNITTKSIYCINLIFKKQFKEFFTFFYSNRKFMNVTVFIYYTIIKFIVNNNIDLTDIDKAKLFSKLTFENYLKPLFEKIKLLQNKDYKKILEIKLNDQIHNNELFLYAFTLCDLKAKQALNLDFSEEQNLISTLSFNN